VTESPATFAQLIIRPQIPVLHRPGYYTFIERDIQSQGVHLVPVSISSDGAGGAPCELKGWYLQTNPKNPVVIYSHGIHSCRGDLVPLALEMYRHGVNGFVYDLRAHGLSTAKAITLGFHERHDMKRLIAGLREKFAFRGVLMFGLSLGGAISLQAADVDDEIRGVVTCSAYWSMRDCFERYFELTAPGEGPAIDVILAEAARMGEFDLAQTGPDYWVPRLEKFPKLLLIQGGRDTLVEPKQAKLIEKAWEGSVTRKEIAAAAHNDAFSYPETMDLFRNFVLEFVGS